jgi:hypothetical protein
MTVVDQREELAAVRLTLSVALASVRHEQANNLRLRARLTAYRRSGK